MERVGFLSSYCFLSCLKEKQNKNQTTLLSEDFIQSMLTVFSWDRVSPQSPGWSSTQSTEMSNASASQKLELKLGATHVACLRTFAQAVPLHAFPVCRLSVSHSFLALPSAHPETTSSHFCPLG